MLKNLTYEQIACRWLDEVAELPRKARRLCEHLVRNGGVWTEGTARLAARLDCWRSTMTATIAMLSSEEVGLLAVTYHTGETRFRNNIRRPDMANSYRLTLPSRERMESELRSLARAGAAAVALSLRLSKGLWATVSAALQKSNCWKTAKLVGKQRVSRGCPIYGTPNPIPVLDPVSSVLSESGTEEGKELTQEIAENGDMLRKNGASAISQASARSLAALEVRRRAAKATPWKVRGALC